MKKLTAGIFSVLLGAVSVSAADAAITSKKYVDDQLELKADASVVTELSGTVASNKTATDAAIDDLQEVLGDADKETGLLGAVANLNSNLTNNILDTQALQTTVSGYDGTGGLVGDVNALKTTVGDTTGGLVKDVNALKASLGTEGNVADQIATALAQYTTTENLEKNYAQKATTLAGYGITDAYTKTEADAAFDAKGAAAAAQTAAETKVTELANGQVKTNTDAIAAINNEATGILKKATDYTDTKVTTSLSNYATTEALTTGLAGKQGNLDTDQLAALDSGITAAKVTTYDGYAAQITAAKNQADKGVSDAATAKAVADTAIQNFTAEGGNGLYVFTAKVVGDSTTYKWEQIQRGTGEITE